MFSSFFLVVCKETISYSHISWCLKLNVEIGSSLHTYTKRVRQKSDSYALKQKVKDSIISCLIPLHCKLYTKVLYVVDIGLIINNKEMLFLKFIFFKNAFQYTTRDMIMISKAILVQSYAVFIILISSHSQITVLAGTILDCMPALGEKSNNDHIISQYSNWIKLL